ncbi:glutamate synthase [Paenibacillus profundus]|uniref:Glutamate synthase n=1 Tax=Paenibacillus profundus TaxID=1173085 RepID=A0ABS8Y811_9BACL|nr:MULTISPECIES: hypothetical protein [Paenibacillus]MCE5167808.1 glutamate synthase [Paenibacillus profundus]
MAKNQRVIGIVILVAGFIILLGKWGAFAFIGGTMWPLILFVIGVAVYGLVRARLAPPIALVPAGMLTVYGLLFMASHWIHWRLFGLLWPLLLIGIALGLYGYYVYDPHHPRGAWLGALLFGGVGIAMLTLMLVFAVGTYMIAVALIFVGAALVFGGVRSRFR